MLIDESKKLYELKGKQLIRDMFSAYENRIAVGLCGHGSECFGFDDEISQDHDYENGFCLFLTDEDDLLFGRELSVQYSKLISGTTSEKSAMSEKKLGVIRISDFYRRYTGSSGAPESMMQWLSIPSYALAEATNGEIWRDDLGIFSSIRQELLYGMPEDIRKKKIAKAAIIMAQSGQYNYSRCIKHGQLGSAQLAADEFVRNACELIFLLNKSHAPYYKWVFKKMESLEKLSSLKDALEFILLEQSLEKAEIIEDICITIIKEMKAQHLTHGNWDYLEPHAYDVIEGIDNQQLKAMHIMEG